MDQTVILDESAWEESFVVQSVVRAVKLPQSKRLTKKPNAKIVVKRAPPVRGSFNVLQRCQECGKNFGTKFALKQHSSTEHGLASKKPTRKQLRHCCKTCSIRFPNKKLLKNHVEVTHEKTNGSSSVSLPNPGDQVATSEAFDQKKETCLAEPPVNLCLPAKLTDPLCLVNKDDCTAKERAWRKRKPSEELLGNPTKRSGRLS